MKHTLIVLFIATSVVCSAQTHIDQGGLKSDVISNLKASDTQAKTYNIATIGYNSSHWQSSGTIVFELWHTYYGTGYEKYILELGYGQGTGGSSPSLRLIFSSGQYHNAQIRLGTAIGTGVMYGGYENKQMPIYLDVKYYSKYRVKITYQQTKVSTNPSKDQIAIHDNTTGSNISDFTIPDMKTIIRGQDPYIQLDASKLWRIGELSDSDFFIKQQSNGFNSFKISGANGNVSLGNNSMLVKYDGDINMVNSLFVEGEIETSKVKVTTSVGSFPDYVFSDSYDLMPLNKVNTYIRKYKHLPGLPTAIEVEEKGQDLALIQRKLLEKIEELTLYLIDQEKRMKEMEEQLKKLK
ncbi:MAG: hypothetical protein HWE07_06150, partial [Cytophagia bacterium]|nr:hypothetical protein [Cytophagia bacterium]